MFQGPFRAEQEIILASASPRRQDLLSSLGIYFQVYPHKTKEPNPQPGENPQVFALNIAKSKAQDLLKRRKNVVIIAADTIVVFKGEILGKPKDERDAAKTLNLLAGNNHEVITGCCIYDPLAKRKELFAVNTKVYVADMDQSILEAYLKTGECKDKAGSYAIQGAGGFLVDKIDGSYTNVVGLPLREVVTVLLKIKALAIAGKSDFENMFPRLEGKNQMDI